MTGTHLLFGHYAEILNLADLLAEVRDFRLAHCMSGVEVPLEPYEASNFGYLVELITFEFYLLERPIWIPLSRLHHRALEFAGVDPKPDIMLTASGHQEELIGFCKDGIDFLIGREWQGNGSDTLPSIGTVAQRMEERGVFTEWIEEEWE